MEHTDEALSTRDLASPNTAQEAGADPAQDIGGGPSVAEREPAPLSDPGPTAPPDPGSTAMPDPGSTSSPDRGATATPDRDAAASPGGGAGTPDRGSAPTLEQDQTSAQPDQARAEPVRAPVEQEAEAAADGDGTLLSTELSSEFQVRWERIQTQFDDQPRGAVEDADQLVATVMQKLAEGFAGERERLEAQWGRGEDISTEDLRMALRRYRSFFQRLLSA
jgi:hypothetical protein